MALAKKILFLVVLSAFLIACKTAPLKNVNDVMIDAKPGVSLENISKSIVLAGNGIGWKMKQVEPGLMIGTLHVRSKHVVLVRITYNTKIYNIDYKSSTNMNYNPSDPVHDGQEAIHPNYNKWVINLKNAINTQLHSL